MKRTVFLFLLGVLFIASIVAAAGSHDPITILGNGDFTAENGVISGSGTVEDPYLIAGWEISVPSGVPYGVKVENASVSFILRGLVISGAMEAQGAAVRLGFVSSAVIEDCTVGSSMNGIEIASSTDVVARRCILYVQGRGLRVLGETPAEYRHQIEQSNAINDYPVYYLYGKDGETVSGIHSSNLTVAASRSMTITENEIVCGDGMHLAFVEDSLISGNTVHRLEPTLSEHGISLYRSTGNTVSDNLLKNNRRAGMQLWLSSGNSILNNQLLANDYGLIIAASDDNRVYDNWVYANPTGIEISAGSTGNEVARNTICPIYDKNPQYGIVIKQAVANRVEKNVIVESEIAGIFLDTQANSNTVVANTIVAGAYGMLIVGSNNEIARNLIAQNSDGTLFRPTFGKPVIRGNTFYNNVFTDNSHRHISFNDDSEGNRLYRNFFLGAVISNVRIYDPGRNTWTVSGEGNFWEDYDGCDADGDGFGDDPVLVLPAGVNDTAPLLSPTGARNDLGVLSTLEERVLAVLTEGGNKVQIAALIADEGYERFVGFRGFPALLIEDFPGILFDYGEEVQGGPGPTDKAFTMEKVPFPLDIAFFDRKGALVGSTTMEADSSDRYTVNSLFQYALELQSGSLSAWGIGADSRLILPEEGEG